MFFLRKWTSIAHGRLEAEGEEGGLAWIPGVNENGGIWG